MAGYATFVAARCIPILMMLMAAFASQPQSEYPCFLPKQSGLIQWTTPRLARPFRRFGCWTRLSQRQHSLDDKYSFVSINFAFDFEYNAICSRSVLLLSCP
ncbi:hypothetical protein BC941DRAFT_155357 [Chlamydoabsidia padenii]|nr:hypothetical protein BC941DRAFT_155357 [Chlamydoabsidia padenii]